MAHRYLILAYVLTWTLQFGYVGILAAKWRAEKRAERAGRNYGPAA